jgi:Protein of unknown function (DUF1579)
MFAYRQNEIYLPVLSLFIVLFLFVTTARSEGTSMGQPFEGMGIMGYDNEKKQYQSVWIDNMGTGIMTGSGNYDPNTKTLTDQGKFSCPAEGEKSYRAVLKMKDNDNFTYEWYMAGPDGKEFRAMEIVYTRKK